MSLTDLTRMAAEVVAIQYGGPSARVADLSLDEVEFQSVEGTNGRLVDAFIRATVRLVPYSAPVSIHVNVVDPQEPLGEGS